MPATATARTTTRADGGARAIAWRRATHARVCDVLEPWEHGTALRCTAHPGFWAFNALRVEGPRPGLDAGELVAVADRFGNGLRHRRVGVEHEATGARLRPAFDRLGWVTERLAWLALADAPAGPDAEEAPVAATRRLRLEWARSEEPGHDEGELERQADAEEIEHVFTRKPG